jgi:hypothetical protein
MAAPRLFTSSALVTSEEKDGQAALMLFVTAASTLAVTVFSFLNELKKSDVSAAVKARNDGKHAEADAIESKLIQSASEAVLENAPHLVKGARKVYDTTEKKTKATSMPAPQSLFSKVLETAEDLYGIPSSVRMQQFIRYATEIKDPWFDSMRTIQDYRTQLLNLLYRELSDDKYSSRQSVKSVLSVRKQGPQVSFFESKRTGLDFAPPDSEMSCVLNQVKVPDLFQEANVLFGYHIGLGGKQHHRANLEALRIVLTTTGLATRTFPYVGALSAGECSNAGNVSTLTGQWGLQDCMRLSSTLATPGQGRVPHIIVPHEALDIKQIAALDAINVELKQVNALTDQPILLIKPDGRLAVPDGKVSGAFGAGLVVTHAPSWPVLEHEFTGQVGKGHLGLTVMDAMSDRFILPIAGIEQGRPKSVRLESKQSGGETLFLLYSDARSTERLGRRLHAQRLSAGKNGLLIFSPFFDPSDEDDGEIAFRMEFDAKKPMTHTYVLFAVRKRCFARVMRQSKVMDQVVQGWQEKIQLLFESDFGKKRWSGTPTVMAQDIIQMLGKVKTGNARNGLPVSLFVLWQP